MKPLLVAALGLGLGAGCLTAQAQDDGPRQLGGAPALPTYTPRPAAPAAPAAPARTPVAAPAATTAASTDSVKVPAAATAPLPAPLPAPTSPAGNRPYIMGGNAPQQPRYQVGLRSGQLYNVYDVEVKSPLFGRSYLLLDGQRRVDLSDVGFYENETGHYVRTTLPGSAREATLRREKTGRISLYATYNTNYSPGYYGAPGFGYGGLGGVGYGGFGGYPYGSGYRTTKTEYFSKDNGPIQNLTTRNLQLATTDNPGVQELLAQSRRSQTAITGAYVVGGGLLLAGLYQSFRPGSTGVSYLTYAAIPVLIVPIVLQGKQSSAQRQAIALYNSGAR